MRPANPCGYVVPTEVLSPQDVAREYTSKFPAKSSHSLQSIKKTTSAWLVALRFFLLWHCAVLPYICGVFYRLHAGKSSGVEEVNNLVIST